MSLERDPSTGPTLGLDFPKGRVFADETYNASGLSVHHMGNMGSFTLVVSFSRHDFRLMEDYVVAALESASQLSGIRYSVLMFHARMLVFTLWIYDPSPALNSNATFSCGECGMKLGH